MRGLKGKVAVVTGGLGDLGYASAQRLVEEGCAVTVFDVKEDEGERAKQQQARHEHGAQADDVAPGD